MKVTVTRASESRIYPESEEQWLFRNTAGQCRLVGNLYNDMKQTAYDEGWNFTKTDMKNCLPMFKRWKQYEWFKIAPAQTLQQSIDDTDTGWDRYFKKLAERPRMKKKHTVTDSFRFPQPEVDVQFPTDKQGWVQFPKCKPMRYAVNRFEHYVENGKRKKRALLPYEGELLYVTIKRKGDKWYAVFTYKVEIDIPNWYDNDTDAPMHDAIGIDVGVWNTAYLSNGEVFQLPKITKAEEQKLLTLQREIYKKDKDSNNRIRARINYQEALKKIRNRKVDAIHKLSHDLAKSHRFVMMEDIDIAKLTRNYQDALEEGYIDDGQFTKAEKTKLNRAILESCWGELKRQLKYKCEWYGGVFVLVNPAYTSQKCSKCGHTEDANRNGESFKCLHPLCGYTAHADYNAAVNIREAGLAKVRQENIRNTLLFPVKEKEAVAVDAGNIEITSTGRGKPGHQLDSSGDSTETLAFS